MRGSATKLKKYFSFEVDLMEANSELKKECRRGSQQTKLTKGKGVFLGGGSYVPGPFFIFSSVFDRMALFSEYDATEIFIPDAILVIGPSCLPNQKKITKAWCCYTVTNNYRYLAFKKYMKEYLRFCFQLVKYK